MRKRNKADIPLILLELEDKNYHILVESEFINGEKGYWVVDTGASKTVFDSSLKELYIQTEDSFTEIESAGIGDLKIETKAGYISTVSFGEFIFQDLQVGLIDLSALNNLYCRFTDLKISGLIGSDFLVKYKANINYEKLILSLLL